MGEDEKKSVLSPRQTWSPHTAALHRRRQMAGGTKAHILGSLGGLSLDDEGEEDLFAKALAGGGEKKSRPNKFAAGERPKGKPVKSRSRRKASPRRSVDAATARNMASEAKSEYIEDLRESIEKHDPAVQAKLRKIIDPRTTMKEKLQIELEMRNIPEERKILSEFKYKADRKSINVKLIENDAEDVAELVKALEEEEKRKTEEEKEFAKRRQERIEEEIAKQEREAKLARDVHVHKVKGIVEGAEELRKEAERTAKAALRNKEKKILAQEEKDRMIKNFLEGEGKYLTDVEKELRIARMLNEAVGDV